MHGRLFLGSAILATAILIGCGSGNSSPSSGSGAAGQPVAAGDLAVFPATLNFGKVTMGTKKALTATLTAGNAGVIVRSAEWGGPGFSVAGIVFPFTVPAGQSTDFKVTFAPQAAGQVSGNIKFVSNAENSTHAVLNGNGTQTAAHQVTLAWHAPTTTVVGYNVYRGAAVNGPFLKMTSSPHPQTTFTDASVVGATTYFYMITAVSTKGKESKYSNRVQVSIPNS